MSLPAKLASFTVAVLITLAAMVPLVSLASQVVA